MLCVSEEVSTRVIAHVRSRVVGVCSCRSSPACEHSLGSATHVRGARQVIRLGHHFLELAAPATFGDLRMVCGGYRANL